MMTISQGTGQGSFASHRWHFDAQVMIWSRRRVIAVLQAPRIAGLVEAEGRRRREWRRDPIPVLCEKRGCRLKFLSGVGELGPPASCKQLARPFVSSVAVPVPVTTERDGNNGWNRQAGQVRWCGRTWWAVGRVGSLGEALAERGHQAAAATAGGWGSRARCAGTAGAAGQQQAQSGTVQPPLNLKVAC